MLDHAFWEIIQIIKAAFAGALLDREQTEERFPVDILLGDAAWETSYCLPGEGNPPRVRADLSLDWPTWSQTAYRSWTIGDRGEEPPELGIEMVLRIQRLAAKPDIAGIARALPTESPSLGREPLIRSAPTLEQVFDVEFVGAGWALEFAYEGTYELTDDVLEDRALLRSELGILGGWVASTLITVGDMKLAFLPPEEIDQ